MRWRRPCCPMSSSGNDVACFLVSGFGCHRHSKPAFPCRSCIGLSPWSLPSASHKGTADRSRHVHSTYLPASAPLSCLARPLRCSALSSHLVVVACSVLWSRETTSVLAGMQTGAPCLGPGGPWGGGRKPNNRPASFGWRSHRGTLASEVEPLKPRQFRTLLFQPLLPLQPAGM